MAKKSETFRQLIARTEKLPPLVTAVVHPCDPESLRGAVIAQRRNLIRAVLVGPEHKIRRAAAAARLSIRDCEIVSTEHSHAAAETAVRLVREQRVECLMKGSLHTDELVSAVVDAGKGLRTSRRISHVFVLDVPAYPRALLVSDAAINISPDLETKCDIVQNAIDLAHALRIDRPRVAILSAVETVTPKIPSTIDAAALCKMADRGQITGAILDGPLAFDNAISEAARRVKRIESTVAGRPDILVVPDLEAGNMLVKTLQYLSGAKTAGIVLGARVPIALTSRADTVQSRLASAAIAVLLHHTRHSGRLVS
ncbi:MAG: bifunctional enoyl-CoA hydratase/phosphate acetyltransferase [Burkholderiales bacterium]